MTGLGVTGVAKSGLGLGFPPPLGFGFEFPFGLGFVQIGFSVGGGDDIIICSNVPSDGCGVPTIAGIEVTGSGSDEKGAIDGGGVEEGGGEGPCLGQSLDQIASLLQ